MLNMGVQISSLIEARELEIQELAGKKVAIDAYNIIYQFLATIRDRFTGEPLKDSEGRVTSHLSGLIYRFSKTMEAGVKPIMVFDGKPPSFKMKTLMARKERKEAAMKKWEDAKKKGEAAYKYAQATTRMDQYIIESSKELLGYMGVPILQAPSEGEATCAEMCRGGLVDFSSSQDYDSLLFGSPKLIRNLSISGKRKLPGKETWVEVKPELIELEKALGNIGINREQLITMGLLIGTDYNDGVKGIGPKTALKMVKEHKTLDEVLKHVEWKDEMSAHDLFEWFMNPPVLKGPQVKWSSPQTDKIMKFMVEEHSFSRTRIENIMTRLNETSRRGAQSSLGNWLKK